MVEVLSLAAAVAMLMAVYEYRELRRLKVKAWEAVATADAWKRKYEQLVEDVRLKAMEARVILDASPARAGTRKARSSAEVRRVFEEVNGRE